MGLSILSEGHPNEWRGETKHGRVRRCTASFLAGWVSLPEYKLKFKSRLPDIFAPSVGGDILPGLNARILASELITESFRHFDARWLVVLEDGESSHPAENCPTAKIFCAALISRSWAVPTMDTTMHEKGIYRRRARSPARLARRENRSIVTTSFRIVTPSLRWRQAEPIADRSMREPGGGFHQAADVEIFQVDPVEPFG